MLKEIRSILMYMSLPFVLAFLVLGVAWAVSL